MSQMIRYARTLRCPLLAVLPLLFGLAAGAKDKVEKSAVPDRAAQTEAAKLVAELYSEDLAKAKKPEQKSALARRLLQAGVEEKDAAGKYAVLTLARDTAAQAADLHVAIRAVDEMDKAFAIDALQARADAAMATQRSLKTPEQRGRFAELADGVVGAALAADRYGVAKQVGDSALAAARSAKDPDVLRRATDRASQVREAEAGYAAVEKALAVLEREPADPDANTTVGRFRGFIKGDWAAALPMLARGGDADLRALAAKELKELETPAAAASARVALADGWWDLLQAEKSPTARRHLQSHAHQWYARSLPGLTGLAKAKAEKRLQALAAAAAAAAAEPGAGGAGPEVPLFDGKTLDGWQTVPAGRGHNWSARGGLLVNEARGAPLMTNEKFQDFELSLEFWLARGANSGVYLRGRYEVQLIDLVQPAAPEQQCGAIYGLIPPARQTYRGPERWNTLRVRLVGRRVSVWMNGGLIVDDKPIERVTGQALDNRENEPGPILLQAHGGVLRFRDIRLTRIGS